MTEATYPQLFEPQGPSPGSDDMAERAEQFCVEMPHRAPPYSRRDWGGRLHSLCSYQGKLKPAIAHFLVSWFTKRGDRVLDPLSGVGTIPLEARRQGRIGIASDLSRVAECVSRAKLEPFSTDQVATILEGLGTAIETGPDLEQLSQKEDLEFGLNGPVREYFHPETLREVVIARKYFLSEGERLAAAPRDVVLSSLLHILHGNRPYALSRRSHPVTPFAPTGPSDYRPVVAQLEARLRRVLPSLLELHESSPDGLAVRSDFRELALPTVDAVITSPPFAKSVRFWSMNWMRLWFVGWSRSDFDEQPAKYLETEQRRSLDVYADFAERMASLMRPEGTLVMHLGETARVNMVEEISPHLQPYFHVRFVGRESVVETESHGLTDKGSTVAHWYLFATRSTSARA